MAEMAANLDEVEDPARRAGLSTFGMGRGSWKRKGSGAKGIFSGSA
jgi:hypothetical protein